MPESGPQSRTSWLRWGLVAAILLAGLALLLLYGPLAPTLVPVEEGLLR